MAYTVAWLEDPSAVRAVFAEIVIKRWDTSAWVTETLYVSTAGYMTSSADVSFNPIIAGGLSLTESMSVDGGLSFSFGDISIHNDNGEYDTWLNTATYIWTNGTINLYLGDPFWVTNDITSFKNDFLQIFSGIVADIDSRSRETINIKIRDKMQKLNVPITENKIGPTGIWAGGQNNKEEIRPLVFGEVFNFEPTLVDPSQLKYMFCDGEAEKLTEVRDNGVPVYTDTTLTTGATVSLSGGIHYFSLSKPLAGGIGISVQGIKRSINLSTGVETATYTNTISNIIALIVMKYGNANSQLTWSEIDSVTFSDTSYAKPVGILIKDKENILSVCQSLADSIGAQIYFDRSGKLKILRLGTYITAGVTVNTITDSDILHHSLSISSRITPVAAVTKIGYAKNWMVQEGLLTGIPDEHKELFAKEWYPESSSENATAKTYYKLFSVPEQKDTMLITLADATAEANRLNNQQSVVRTIYKFTGRSSLLNLVLGQQVTLIHNRFNLYNNGNGVQGQVYSLSPNWLNSTIEVEVII